MLRQLSTRSSPILKMQLLLIAACLLAVARLFAPQDSTASTSHVRNDGTAKAAFAEAYKVFMHPRCVNCHPAGDSPLRGEDSQPHAGLRLHRGADGQGVFTLKCTNCHQAQNQEGLHMPPGAPNVLGDGSLDLTTPRWHLPPAQTPMIFQGRSAALLCRQLQDPKQNGGLTAEQLIHHV
jgi:cytochrome c5